MTIKTVKLDDGKYQFDLDEQTGLMMAARRHGGEWPTAFNDWRFSKCFMAALNRIIELEEATRPKTFVEAATEYNVAKAEFDARFGAEIECASLPGLLQSNPAALANVDQLVAAPTVRADEVNAEAVDAGLDGGKRNLNGTADAQPHDRPPVTPEKNSASDVEIKGSGQPVAIPEPDTTHYAQWAGDKIKYHSVDQLVEYANACVAAAFVAREAAQIPPAPPIDQWLAKEFGIGRKPLVFSRSELTKCWSDAIAYGLSVQRIAPEDFVSTRVAADDSICAVCDGGPGNACTCACGLKRWERAEVSLTGELVEDVLDETMFVKHQTESTLYHELVRSHERMGGTLFKEAADAIRAQRKQIFALEGREATDTPSTNLGEEAMQRAAGELPVGYDMRICLENGSGWIEIDDAEGNELTLETDTEGMTDRINESIDIAIAHAAEAGVKS